MIKLGSIAKDTATGLKGMVTVLQVGMDGRHFYLVQPKGLNPETRQPVKRLWVVESRLEGGEHAEIPDLPVEVLGTQVEDVATGFSGMAVNLLLHISGCVHVEIQPPGALKSGDAVESCNFDIRQLKGKAIAAQTER